MRRKTVVKLLGIGASSALLAALIGVCLYSYYQVLPVEGWYKQAYAAADAEQMACWLDNLLSEMRKMGMTEGHYALVFKNPHNNVALDIQVFENLRSRCLEVAKYPKGSMDYAESLEDIRRQMDKTDFDPWWWMMVNRHGGWAWLLVTVWAWFPGALIVTWLVLKKAKSQGT
jgi:hypothetical protein